MILESRIKKLKDSALKKVEDAAKIGDTSAVVSSSKIVEQIDDAERKYEHLVSSLDRIERALNQNGASIDFSLLSSTPEDKKLSYKKKGELRRKLFVERLLQSGINVVQVKGVVYKINDRQFIGVASAYENKNIPNRWFLGLPPENFDTIVLLCERKNGEVLRFIFSRDFFQKYKSHLSTDDRGQTKFNVAQRNTDYVFIVPNIGSVSITNFLDNFDNLTTL